MASSVDTEPPVVINKYFDSLTENGYWACFSVTDNVGVKNVRVAVWTKNDQSDIKWIEATSNGAGTYYVAVNRSEYTNSSVYHNHAYVYDNAGNATLAGIDMDYTVPPNIFKSYFDSVTDEKYWVCFSVNDRIGIKTVRVAIWTQDDKSDIKWYDATSNGQGTYFTEVLRSDFPDSTKYYNHAYAYNKADACGEEEIIMDYNPKTTVLGDVDGDNEVTILDATCIQRKLASIPIAKYIEEAADVDGDGSVSIIDATCIQRHLVQLPTPEGIGKPIA